MNCVLAGVHDIEELMCIVAAQLYNIGPNINVCTTISFEFYQCYIFRVHHDIS